MMKRLLSSRLLASLHAVLEFSYDLLQPGSLKILNGRLLDCPSLTRTKREYK